MALLGSFVKPASAAVIHSRLVEISVEGEGFLKRSDLVVEMKNEEDLETWSRYPIAVNEFITLEAATMEVLSPAGKVVETVPRRRFEAIESPGWELYSSSLVYRVPFEALEVGQSLRLSVTTRHRPPFPSATVYLAVDEDQERLRVRVRGAQEDLRWHLRGAPETFRLDSAGELELNAEGVEAWEREPWSPSGSSQVPILLLAWGDAEDWAGVGLWYEGFKGDLPRTGSRIDALAKELTEGLKTPRQQVEVLTDYVKRKVRYEAVEIGEGGWRPTEGSKTLDRGWGDCKDKSELLLSLLERVGIPGHLALVRAGRGERIERDFPTPYQFNHAVVALPAEAAGAVEKDPVADGFLFIDPTVERGAVQWLSPFSGGRPVLVVDGPRSRLVETPTNSEAEARELRLAGVVDESGTLRASFSGEYRGQRAVSWIQTEKTRNRDRILERIQRLVHGLAPGALVEKVGWAEEEGPVPTMRFEAVVRIDSFVRGEAGRRWFRPGAFTATPEPRDLEERIAPISLSPGVRVTSWTLELPATWCPPQPRRDTVDNEVGSLTFSVEDLDGSVAVEHRLELRESFVDGADVGPLQEIALAEHRASKRRVRLRCPQNE